MIEFISETAETEEPPPILEAEEPELPEPKEVQESLEVLVEAHAEELRELQVDQDYVDEPSSPQGDYHQPDDTVLKDAPDLKEELKPLVYEENDQVIVVDIFERYGKKEDQWWKSL